jgi:hypothetical protein
MPTTRKPTCRRCGQPLAPVYVGQVEHPLCSPTDTGWIPKAVDPQTALPLDGPARLALDLAAIGWHVFPLSPTSKRPLANCPTCRDRPTGLPHRIEDCPCIPAGRWCHGVRAATTNPERITTWWTAEPDAVAGVAAGPSGLVLVDIDAHGTDLPADLATGLLPGINLEAEPIPAEAWRDRSRFRDGRDCLTLLARIRGGEHPWPAGLDHRPVTVATPSGGRHLWYRAPATGLRQALAEPNGLAWQVDIKAGWSYGLAPSAVTASGTYAVRSGDPGTPGRMPTWLAREVIRVAGPRPARPTPPPAPARPTGQGHAKYLNTVIDRGAAELAQLKDGRKLALSALAYKAGGLLAWSGLPHDQVHDQLVTVGTTSGLNPALARRIVTRALANGTAAPLPAPPAREDRRAS